MFEKGQIYVRRELHDKYGGNRQSGISRCPKHGIILLFTSERGKEFGYEDGWKDGFFYYCGEGQIGDMKFVRGNKAIRDHQIEGYELHLFESISKGMVKYIGQFVCVGYDFQEGHDLKGNRRKMIVFKLMPYEDFIEFTKTLDSEFQVDFGNTEFTMLRELAYGRATLSPKIKEAKANYIERAGIIKEYALMRAKGRCEFCNSPAPFLTKELRPYLEIHHIHRLSDGGPDDPRWVIALCPNCHRMAHYSKDAEIIREKMQKIVMKKEESLGS